MAQPDGGSVFLSDMETTAPRGRYFRLEMETVRGASVICFQHDVENGCIVDRVARMQRFGRQEVGPQRARFKGDRKWMTP